MENFITVKFKEKLQLMMSIILMSILFLNFVILHHDHFPIAFSVKPTVTRLQRFEHAAEFITNETTPLTQCHPLID